MIRKLILAAAVAIATLAAVPTAYSYRFIGAVWPDWNLPVPYCVNVNDIPVGTYGTPIMSGEAFAGQVQYAFQQWQDVSGGWISFAYQGYCDNSPWDDRDGVNTVGWASLFENAVGATGPQMSHSKYLRDGTFGEIYESDIIIDTRLAQSYEDPTYFIQVELPHILLHEAGHFAGLDHSEVECATMAPVGLRFGFCQDDIDGIRALYPPR
jgi:hypothetical protein